MKILITGGCGFIGLNLIKFLLDKEFNYIRILDNLSTGSKEALENILSEYGKIQKKVNKKVIKYGVERESEGKSQESFLVELIMGDISSYKTCIGSSQNIETVIHLAAHTGIIPSIKNPLFDFKVNVIGTLNMLKSSVESKVDKFIFASSGAPLGNQNPPINENKVPKPLSPYGASKLAGEGYCSAFFNSYGLKTISLRFSNVYGPYSTYKSSVIAEFFKKICNGKPITIYGDGNQTRDFLYVYDLCSAVFKIINFANKNSNESLANSRIWGGTLQIASGFETSINNLFHKIKSIVEPDIKRKINFKYEPYRKGEILRNYSDISLAKKLLNYHPEFNLDKGLEITWDWFYKNYKK